jgi:hypothetical protein
MCEFRLPLPTSFVVFGSAKRIAPLIGFRDVANRLYDAVKKAATTLQTEVDAQVARLA